MAGPSRRWIGWRILLMLFPMHPSGHVVVRRNSGPGALVWFIPTITQYRSFLSRLSVLVPKEEATALWIGHLTGVEPAPLIRALFLDFEVFGWQAWCTFTVPDAIREETPWTLL